MMPQRLFLSANFEDFSIGLAEGASWVIQIQKQGHIADQLYTVLQPIVAQCHYKALTIYLLNGPGSTLGIRTLCTFINTLIALNYIQPLQVYCCDTLHFAQNYCRIENKANLPICARVNLTQTLCLGPSPMDIIHSASEVEKQQALWLPHPCLPKNFNLFSFKIESILTLLTPMDPWYYLETLDIFDPA